MVDTISQHRLKHSYWEKPIVESDGSIWCAICGARLKPDKPEKIGEFELWGINEDIVFNDEGIAQNETEIITKNIEYVLKREGLWKEGMSVILPSGALAILDIENETYQYDFEVFEEDGNTMAYRGTCYGTGTWFDFTKRFLLHDMTVELYRGD